MTKKDFLTALASGLKELPPDKVSDILFDYQDYFESKKDSMTEAEAILALGSIDNLILNYKKENSTFIKDKTLSFTKEIPVIDDEYLDNHKKNTSLNEDEILKDTNYVHVADDLDDSKSKDSNTDKATNETTKDFNKNCSGFSKKEKQKFTKKGFFGYLFSLPLLAISLPIGFGLSLAAIASYFALILLSVCIGLGLFLVSSIPLILSGIGFFILVAKNLAPMFFYNLPNFVIDFPGTIILFISLSFIFLFVFMFSLGIAYCKSTKNVIINASTKILSCIFKRGA